MKLTIEVKVSLNGAKVELSREQREAADGFVRELLGDKKKVLHTVKHRKTIFGVRPWAKEGDEKIREATLQIPEVYKSIPKMARAIASELHRTPRAIEVRAYTMRAKRPSLLE